MTVPRPALPLSVSAVAGALAITLGAGVLAGWAFDIEWLRSVAPRFIVMLPNTAVGMIAGGAAILLLSARARGRGASLARVLSSFVLALGALSFLERVFGWDIGFDRLLFAEKLAAYPYRPLGLMATNSTIAMTLAGVGLLAAGSASARARMLSRRTAALGAAIAAVALLGHLYGASALYTFDQAAGMALLTAAGFALLHVGVLFMRPDEGGVSLLMRRDLTGALLRPLLLLTVLVPVALGRLWIESRQRELVGRETGVAIFVVLVVLWIVTLLLRTGAATRAADEERARVLEREQHARAAAEAANKAKSDFLAVVSHELRTPLNAILGYQSLLTDRVLGPVSDAQERHLQRIGSSARHLTSIVDQILTLARTDGGGAITVDQERVSVDALLQEVAGIGAPLASAKHLDLRCDCDPELTVVTDASKVRQILINLIGNAVKFTDAGSVTLSARREGDSIAIDVRDTGIGIAPEHLNHIFDEFWQAEAPLTRRAGGAGLGLAVSRQFANALGATIDVTSTLGEGSQFTLRLPGAVSASSPTGNPGRAAT